MLAGTRALASTDGVDIAGVAALGNVRRVGRGTAMLSQGHKPTHIYFLVDGAAKLLSTNTDGQRVLIGLRHAPWFLGSIALMLDRESPVDGIALVTSTVVQISRQRFQMTLSSNAAFADLIHRLHAEELYEQIQSYSQLGTATVRARLAQLLWVEAHAKGLPITTAPLAIQCELRRSEMAEALACSVEHLCRILSQLEHQGALERHHNTVTITNPRDYFSNLIHG